MKKLKDIKMNNYLITILWKNGDFVTEIIRAKNKKIAESLLIGAMKKYVREVISVKI